MLILDLIAASANEGLSLEPLRKWLPKTAAGELDLVCRKFGPKLYADVIWDERAKESSPPPRRSSIAWPIKRVSNVIPLRVGATYAFQPRQTDTLTFL